MPRVLTPKFVWIPLTAIVGFCALAIVFSFFRDAEEHTEIPFGQVLGAAGAGEVESIEVDGDELVVQFRGASETVESRMDENTDLVAALLDAGATFGTEADAVELSFEETSTWANYAAIAFWLVGYIVWGVIVYFAVMYGVRRAMRKDVAANLPSPRTLPQSR
jgi:hypothetical protein